MTPLQEIASYLAQRDGPPVSLITNRQIRAYERAIRCDRAIVVLRDPSETDGSGPLADNRLLDHTRQPGTAPLIVIAVAPVASSTILEMEAADFAVCLGGYGGAGDHTVATAKDAAVLVDRYLSAIEAVPLQDAHEVDLHAAIPYSIDEAYSLDDILRALLDGGEWLELRADRAPEVLTALGHLGGSPMAIIASRAAVDDGRLTSAGCRKVTDAIRRADARSMPLLCIVDSAGLATGLDDASTTEALIEMLGAVRETTATRCALVVGRAYGPVAVGLGAVGSAADYVAAWPRAEFSLAAPEDAARMNPSLDIRSLHDAASVWHAAREGGILDVIDPAETRSVLQDVFGLFERPRSVWPPLDGGRG